MTVAFFAHQMAGLKIHPFRFHPTKSAVFITSFLAHRQFISPITLVYDIYNYSL